MEIIPIIGGKGETARTRLTNAIDDALGAASSRCLLMVEPGGNPRVALDEVRSLGVPTDAGVLMRTSGSTSGTGKIVALSWDALIASGEATHAALDGPGHWFGNLPTHHIAGFQTVLRSRYIADTEPGVVRYESVIPGPYAKKAM